jgi:hypothetical protein
VPPVTTQLTPLEPGSGLVAKFEIFRTLLGEGVTLTSTRV